MSMNLHIEATRKVIAEVKGTPKFTTQEITFDLWQTPTSVTYSVLEMEDKLQGYIDWVDSVSEDKQWPIYADNDIFGNGNPIGYETINAGKGHIQELKEWIKYCDDEGYTIEWFYM